MTQKVLGNLAQGLVFIVSAPAGTGKTTLTRMLTTEFDCVEESVSCTTRRPRIGEIPGVDYHFLTQQEFDQKVTEDDFLEHAEVFGFCYGTSRQYVKDAQDLGKHVVLVIDTQGAMVLKEQGFQAVFIFISPPSIEELKQRLINRNTEDVKTIEKRLSWAEGEMKMSSKYDYVIINQDLDTAYQVLRSIVIAEEHRQINVHV